MQIRTRRRRGRKISRRQRRQSLSRRRSKSRNGGAHRGFTHTRAGLNSAKANSRADTFQRKAAEQNEEENAARAILDQVPKIKEYLAEQVEKKKKEMKRRQEAAVKGLQYEPPTDGDDGDNGATVLANVQSMLPRKYKTLGFNVSTFVATALLLLLASGGLPGADAFGPGKGHLRTVENTGRYPYYSNSGQKWSWLNWDWVPDPEFTGPPIDHSKDNGWYTPWHGTNVVFGRSVPEWVRYVVDNNIHSSVNRDPAAEIDHHAAEANEPDHMLDYRFLNKK